MDKVPSVLDVELFRVVSNGNVDALKTLLQANSSIKLADVINKEDATLLMIAAQYGHVDTVRLLLDSIFYTKIDQTDEGCNTALRLETLRGYIDQTDKHRKTALWWATKMGRVDVIRLLIEHGADVNAAEPLISKKGWDGLNDSSGFGQSELFVLR